MRPLPVLVIGAGIAGLTAALDLARNGVEVTVIEKAASPGGKMRELEVAGMRLDAGPTVFTMRWIFEEIFADAGASLSAYLTMKPVEVLARHAWDKGPRLDLYADIKRSAEAIAAFAGPAESRGYLEFVARARRIYQTLESSFIRAPRPTPLALVRAAGLSGLGALARISPFTSLWQALGEHFKDPRLQQLFGRYATYCGSSPFLAPATLMLIAHVEQEGVWLIEGGMHRLTQALAKLASTKGVTFRYGETVTEVIESNGRITGLRLASGEQLDAAAVVVNADVSAISTGRFGKSIARAVPDAARSTRSLSAVTWGLFARTTGFPLIRHNVFFSGDYASEFEDIFRRSQLPRTPTVYICAQDRDDQAADAPSGPERLLCLVNAPATGDSRRFDPKEIAQCEERTFSMLERCGLQISRIPGNQVITTPADFEQLFPATGGALYGQVSHGWMTSFSRPGPKTSIQGLYLAGGSTHPGAGVPMAALSGRMAAGALMRDYASIGRSR